MDNKLNSFKKIFEGNSKKKYKFHFVGIGGVSMSALALVLLNLGMEVSGSDTKNSKVIKKLKKMGAHVYNHHSEKNVVGADYLVYSFAVENNVEVCKAKELNIPTISRSKLLGILLKTHKVSICIAGAHGKTTTTALIFSILKQAGINPSLHLGGFLTDGEVNCVIGDKDVIVCEACEYKDAFLDLKPQIAIVLNTAPEHLDYFKSYENVKKSFTKFAKSANLLICPYDLDFLDNSNKITIGGKNSDFSAKNLRMKANGTYRFDCFKSGKFFRTFNLNLIGKHNVKNALYAIALADYLGVDKNTINSALTEFCGVQRRFEILKRTPLLIHDYAHHPDEISAVINELRAFYKGKLLVVFQPHTYSRTKKLMTEFSSSLSGEEVFIYKTFSAREKYDRFGSAKSLSEKIDNSRFFKGKNKLIEHVLKKISNGYAVIFLGAGDIDKIAKNIGNLC